MVPSVGKSKDSTRTARSAVVGNVATQGADIAMGQQKSFNWEAVAAAAVAAPLADSAESDVKSDTESTLGTFGSKVAGKLVSSAITQTTQAAFTGGKINYVRIIADGFGNPIANSLLAASGFPSTMGKPQQPTAQQATPQQTAAQQATVQQATTAAGASTAAQDAPLTNNEDLNSRENVTEGTVDTLFPGQTLLVANNALQVTTAYSTPHAANSLNNDSGDFSISPTTAAEIAIATEVPGVVATTGIANGAAQGESLAAPLAALAGQAGNALNQLGTSVGQAAGQFSSTVGSWVGDEIEQFDAWAGQTPDAINGQFSQLFSPTPPIGAIPPLTETSSSNSAAAMALPEVGPDGPFIFPIHQEPTNPVGLPIADQGSNIEWFPTGPDLGNVTPPLLPPDLSKFNGPYINPIPDSNLTGSTVMASTIATNNKVGLQAEVDATTDFTNQGLTVTPRISLTSGSVRSVADIGLSGAPGATVAVPFGFSAEDTAGNALLDANGQPIT